MSKYLLGFSKNMNPRYSASMVYYTAEDLGYYGSVVLGFKDSIVLRTSREMAEGDMREISEIPGITSVEAISQF